MRPGFFDWTSYPLAGESPTCALLQVTDKPISPQSPAFKRCLGEILDLVAAQAHLQYPAIGRLPVKWCIAQLPI